MNYQKIYNNLINRALNRNIDTNEYYEKHHIIPKCMDGIDDSSNIVQLTAREHYIAHGLLVKINKNNHKYFKKLLYSFRYMSVDSHNGNRKTNRDYAWMRKLYSENHPMKDKNISIKTAIGVKQAWADGKFDFRLVPRIEVECACGCGKKFTKKINSSRIYAIANHARWLPERVEAQKKHQSSMLKKHINTLSKDELSQRMKNSFGSCDHVLRGNAISLGKKGKKTNQSNIEAERYGKMSNEDFYNYINGRKLSIQKRMTTKRNRYLDGLSGSNIK